MIQQIEIAKIQFDPTQPRKFIDQEKVKGMAQSILAQGVINPIEIDKDFRIVTGELRYRATKEAGLTEIPCKVIEVSDEDRFERQVIENVHHNTMSSWDTAKSLEKLLSSYHARASHNDTGISQLARKLGKSEGWIRESLSLLEASKEVQEAIKENKISKRQYRDLKSENKEVQKTLEKFVLKNPDTGGSTLAKMRHALHEHPSKSKEIIKIASTKKPAEEIQREISKIAKTKSEQADSLNEYFESIEYHASKLSLLLNTQPEEIRAKGGLLEFNAKLAYSKLQSLYGILNLFFNPSQNELEGHTK